MQTEQTEQKNYTVEDLKSRSFIEKNMGNVIKKTDEEGDISTFSYIKCTDKDPEYVQNARGLVFNGDELVVRAYPFSCEYTVEDAETVRELISSENELSRCRIFKSFEGCLIRVFNISGKWFVSTHRKLNASNSKWSSHESYGEMFEDAIKFQYSEDPEFQERLGVVGDGESVLEAFQKTLDTALVYVFLVSNRKENRIVCDVPEKPSVLHVGTFSSPGSDIDLTTSIGIPFPEKVTFHSVDALLEAVDRVDYTCFQGFVVFMPNGTVFKLLNSDYKYLYGIRGNQASVKFRYLQVRMNRQEREALVYLYPEVRDTIEDYEDIIYKICGYMKNLYVDRFIKKNYYQMPKHEFIFLKQCHSWHRENPKENRITLKHVQQFLNEQTPSTINYMIRQFLTTESANKPQQTEPRKSPFRKNNNRRVINPSKKSTPPKNEN